MLIRNAKVTDFDGILKLLMQICNHHNAGRPDLFKKDGTKFSRDELAAIIANDDKPILLAVDEFENVIGYVFCEIITLEESEIRHTRTTLFIHDLCVDESVRGQKIGEKLFIAAKELAVSKKVDAIELNVWAFNEGAIKFYEKKEMKPIRYTMELEL